MRLFYNGKCIKAMSEGKVMESKSKGILIAKYKFDCSLADLFPEFNEGFEYTYVDEQEQQVDVMTVDIETVTLMTYNAEPDEYGVLTTEVEIETPRLANASDIVTRSIYSNELPTQMIFGRGDSDSEPEIVDRADSLLEVKFINTDNLTSIFNIFRLCRNVKTINASNWDTSNVTNMYCAFYHCHSLISLDVSNWDTSKVTRMDFMFGGCYNLTSLDVSNWDTSKVAYMASIFSNCNNLTSISMNNSDYNSINKIITHLPTRTADSPGYLNIAGVDNISQVDTATAESKFWNVLDHVSIHYDSSYFVQGGMDINGELYDNTNPIYNLCVMTDYIDIEHFKEVCVTTNRAGQGITVCTIFEYNSDKEYIGYVSHETEPKVITTYNKSTDVKYIIITAFNVAYAQITPSDVDFDIDFR